MNRYDNDTYVRHFWDGVQISEDKEACWPWLRSVFTQTGYGQAWIPHLKRQPMPAHRVAWILSYGDPGKYISSTGRVISRRVLHRCPDGPNRLCCNPAHLAVGSDKDNADDRTKDGNTFRGEQVTVHKLTEEDVREARRLYEEEGYGMMELSRMYGVVHGTMRPALLRKTWAHVA